MNLNLNVRPVQFNFGEYINKGFELMKSKFGDIFVGMLVAILMSIIPLCGILAVGNYYKYIKKISRNERASAGEIFDFKDFMPYLILQLIIFGGVLVLFVPMSFVMVLMGAFSGDGNNFNPFLMMPIMFLFFIALYYFLLKAFYMIPLISLKGITDIKTAWKISSTMTKGNVFTILLFAIVASLLSQIGILACGIGLFITMPFMYVANYFAYEHGLSQIEYDEITEIGTSQNL